MRKNYIAYGSNLNQMQMKLRCPSARIVGTAVLEGYELLFRGSKTGSYLTVEKKEGSSVPVAIWSVTEKDEQALDRYEGYPTFYYKEELRLDVTMENNGEVMNLDCFIYIMHEDRPEGVPSKYYVETCLEGYADFGFDEKTLWKAVRRSLRHEANRKTHVS